MRIGLFLVTFDGVETHYCGVGSVTQYFLSLVPRLVRDLEQEGLSLDIHVLYSARPSSGFAHSFRIHERSKRLAAQAGVQLVELPHGGEVANAFGNRRTWPHCCSASAEYISAQVKRSDVGIVLASDTPYAGLPALLAPSSGSLQVVWIAHSTAHYWRVDPAKADEPEREEWEAGAFRAAAQFENAWIGATSQFMKQHLITDCGAPPERIIETVAGIDEAYLHNVYGAQIATKAGILAGYGIPTDLPLFVAFGRAQWYKGLDVALRVGQHLQQEGGVVPVVLAKNDGTLEAHKTLRSLSELARGGSGCVLLTHFDFDLPRWLMAWPRTAAVGVFSHREPFGLIPSEYRSLGPDEGVLVVHPSGGLKEQVTDGADGLVVLDDDERTTARRCADLITSKLSRS